MSSKTKTTNLGLNHWELDDVFQMDDFNQDNAKIDAAMGLLTESLAGAGNLKAELLVDSNGPGRETTQFSIDFAGLNLETYKVIIMGTGHIVNSQINIYPSSISVDCFPGDVFLAFPMEMDNTAHLMKIGENGVRAYKLSTTYSQLSCFAFYSKTGEDYSSYTKVRIWGIK